MRDKCIEWTGHRDPGGYGKVYTDGRQVGAHRHIWEECFGPIPEGECVLHKCDNPPCVNPSHLYLGTQRDNARDRERRGRGNHASGERNGGSKLTDAQCREMRKLREETGMSTQKLARKFGIGKSQAWNIISGNRGES